jgi:hypothetical protein
LLERNAVKIARCVLREANSGDGGAYPILGKKGN